MTALITMMYTPCRGCGYADYLLEKIPAEAQKRIEKTYNAAMRKLGDNATDFMAAVKDLTAEACRVRNGEPHDMRTEGTESAGNREPYAGTDGICGENGKNSMKNGDFPES